MHTLQGWQGIGDRLAASVPPAVREWLMRVGVMDLRATVGCVRHTDAIPPARRGRTATDAYVPGPWHGRSDTGAQGAHSLGTVFDAAGCAHVPAFITSAGFVLPGRPPTVRGRGDRPSVRNKNQKDPAQIEGDHGRARGGYVRWDGGGESMVVTASPNGFCVVSRSRPLPEYPRFLGA